MKINIGCCLCTAGHQATIKLPEGWKHPDEAVDVEDGFCPIHAPVKAFVQAQCAGCVGGWMDCPMWKAFAYSGRSRDIGPSDYKALESGHCPRRVNGTIGVTIGPGSRMEDINLSEPATGEAGAAFAQAIRDYVAKYP